MKINKLEKYLKERLQNAIEMKNQFQQEIEKYADLLNEIEVIKEVVKNG